MKKSLGYYLGNAFAAVIAICVMVLIMALTYKLVMWILQEVYIMAYVKENNTNSSNSISRDGILSKAKSIINGERQGTYGDAEDSFQTIADMWSAYLKTEILSEDVANMMILMKVARNSSGVYKDDNWIDICGYAALGGEIQAAKNAIDVQLEENKKITASIIDGLKGDK